MFSGSVWLVFVILEISESREPQRVQKWYICHRDKDGNNVVQKTWWVVELDIELNWCNYLLVLFFVYMEGLHCLFFLIKSVAKNVLPSFSKRKTCEPCIAAGDMEWTYTHIFFNARISSGMSCWSTMNSLWLHYLIL